MYEITYHRSKSAFHRPIGRFREISNRLMVSLLRKKIKAVCYLRRSIRKFNNQYLLRRYQLGTSRRLWPVFTAPLETTYQWRVLKTGERRPRFILLNLWALTVISVPIRAGPRIDGHDFLRVLRENIISTLAILRLSSDPVKTKKEYLL